MNAITIGAIGLLVGIIGVGFGGIIGIFIKKTTLVFSMLLGITGGLMIYIITFQLLPEAFQQGGVTTVLLGIVIGILFIIILENLLKLLKYNPKYKASLFLGLSIAIHFIPEGLALGSSLTYNSQLGKALIMAMLLHNIPEGLSMSITLGLNRLGKFKTLFFTLLAGLPMGVGAFLGAYLGDLSSNFIAISLSMAAGIMLYITCDEIIPTGKALHKGRASSIGVIIGFAIGLVLFSQSVAFFQLG